MPNRSTVTGGAAIARRLRVVVPGLLPAIGEASRKSLRPMLAAAKANAPKRTGALRRSLTIVKRKGSKLRPSYAIGPRADYVEAGERPARFAHVVEWGRAPNADGKGGERGTRFLTRAFEATAGEVLRIFESTIGPAFLKRVSK